MAKKANRLNLEKSPYLLQHAYNPVDWYPWGQEAFEASKDGQKPIFLSIGYATCHWCHVMEKECFEDVEIAEMMNDAFINIKVDREELPEIDGIYMEFAQGMMSGASGWPLNVILTPDLEPFFAATYLPPEGRHGLVGFKDLIVKIKQMWDSEEREHVLEQAKKIVDIFANNQNPVGDEFPEKEQIEDAVDLLFKMADPIYGGIKGAPKFPIGYQLNFWLRYYLTGKDSRARFLVERTLDMIHRGGIYDHLGGGFSRYSIDEEWLIPHFEKMLYDNAIMAFSYLECWQLTQNPFYKQICKEILDYVLREMSSNNGGFYSAEDADSEGHEGMFYTWTIDEIINILGDEESQLFIEYFGMTEEGNFEGRNVLHTNLNLDEFAKKHNVDVQFLAETIREQKKLLFTVRQNREHPFKDDKILVAWNGLMIYSLVEAGNALNCPEFLDAAVKSANFIKNHMWQDGQLYRRFRDGEVRFNASLSEYACLIRAFLSLFESHYGVDWLVLAIEMTNILDESFKEPDGAFYETDGTDANLILRKCQFSDGSEPSGNAIHCENLLRLYQLTNEDTYIEQAEDIFAALKKYIDNYPPGYSYHMMNLNRYYDKHAPTLVIALDDDKNYENELKNEIYHHFIPHKALIWKQKDDKDLLRVIPFVKDLVAIDGKTTLYICFEGVCQTPINQLPAMIEAIHKL